MKESASAVASHQLALLRKLLNDIIPANHFYHRKLCSTELTAQIRSLEEFAALCPFTLKSELVEDQKSHPPYGTNLTFKLGEYTRFHQTSGTSGQPLRWLDTPESWQTMIESWKEIYRAADVSAADRIYFAFSFGPFLGFWLAFEAATQLGCLCLPGGGLSSTARLLGILDNQVTILCCTPTYALRLAEVAAIERIDLRRSCVKTIIVAGEPGGSVPSTRFRIESSWSGARVFDHHGMTEVGPVSYQCPASLGRLHLVNSAYLAEVVDPKSGSPLTSGEPGELVLTTLSRTASPLLRYRTGDLVKISPGVESPDDNLALCACGRPGILLEGGILARVDDMLIVRGVNVYPSAVEEVIRSSGQVAEYQVILSEVLSMPELRIKVEPHPGCSDPHQLAHQLEQGFSSALSLRICVEVVAPGSLPRFEMKANRWRRA